MGSCRLVRLQAVDREWDEKARRYQDIRAVLGDESALQAERDEERARSERLAGARAELLETELEVKGLRQKIVETDDALYGGRVRNPREVQNLLQGSQQVKGHIAHLEDRALELMEEIEDLEKRLASSGRALTEHERRHAAERQVLTEEFPPPARRSAGAAPAGARHCAANSPTQNSPCTTGCAPGRVGLPWRPCATACARFATSPCPRTRSLRAEDGSGVVTCDGCGRILYRA
jgi:predicted  nucleic acid-binding Zn-ribbon protein